MWKFGTCQLQLLAAAAAASNTAAGAPVASRGHEGAPPIPSSGVPLLHVRWDTDDVVNSDDFRVNLFLACRGSAEGHQRLACEATETPRVYCSLIRQVRQRQPGGRSLRNRPAPDQGKGVLAATPVKPPDTAGSVSNSTAPEVIMDAGSPFGACLRFPMDMGSPDKKTPFVICLEQAAEEEGCRDSGNSFPQDVNISGTEDQERSGGTVHHDAGTKLEDNSTRSMLPQKQMQHTAPRRLVLAAQRLRGQQSGNKDSPQTLKNIGKNSDLRQKHPESVLAAKALEATAAVAAAIGKGQASTEAMTASEAATSALATSHAAASTSSQALTMAKGAVAEVYRLRTHMKATYEARAAALRKLEGDAPGFFG